jgi:hypothetical protein
MSGCEGRCANVEFLNMKPRGLCTTTVAMAVLNLGGFVGIPWDRPGVVAMVATIVLVGYSVLWYYWRGRNWARILVIVTSSLAIGNLLVTIVLFAVDRMDRSSVLYHCVILANAALGAFLVYWLNRKDVRLWFRRSEQNLRIPL